MLDKRLFNEIKDNRAYLVTMCLYGFCILLFSFFTALLLTDVVNSTFIQKEALDKKYWDFIELAILVLVKSVVTFYFRRFFKVVANTQKNKILLNAIADLLKRGPIITREEAAGGIITSWTEAADQIEPFYSEYLPQLFVLMISVPFLLAIAFYYDAISALIMLITGPLLPFFLSLIGMQSGEANKKRLEGLAKLGDSMLDFLNGIRTLKIYNGVEGYRRRIEENSEKFRSMTMQVLKISFLSAFVLEFAATISTAIIAVSLGLRLMYHHIDFFSAFFILLLTPDYYVAIRKFGAKFHTAMGAKAAADNLYRYRGGVEAFSHEEFVFSPWYREQITITLKHVSYQYKDSMVKALNDVSMKIEQGKITAIVGKSGSGKSTLAYLLMRFIEAEGELYFNHIKITRQKPEDIRSMIAYIPQKPYVFHDTVRNNLLHAKQEATEEEIWEALDKAALTKFVQGLSQGLDTMLTEIGSNISVGEAQRLAFARAYLKDSPFIILDESTSALDEENETLLRETFEGLSKKKTVLIIAHRLETVKNANVIYVLEQGAVKETGNHNTLYANKGIYRELVDTWGVIM